MDDLPVKLEGKMSIFSVFSAVVTMMLIFCNAVSTDEVVCVRRGMPGWLWCYRFCCVAAFVLKWTDIKAECWEWYWDPSVYSILRWGWNCERSTNKEVAFCTV